MSDIKIEVKEAIENFRIGKTANLSNKQLITWLSCFLTTIESQTEQFEKLKQHAEHLQALVNGQDQSHTEYVNETETLIEQKDALIESQKEEIEKLKNRLNLVIYQKPQSEIQEGDK